MAGSEELVLKDPQVKPDDKLLASVFGDRMKFWNEISEYLRVNYSDADGTWNYYKDGYNWLYKMVRKKKTIFWGGVLQDSFRITFYFGDKAEPLIMASTLPDKVKESFTTGKRYGNIRAITTKVMRSEDVETIKKLIEIKVRMK